MHYIYTRPCYKFNGEEQFRAILDTFSSEWVDCPQPKRYAESRLKMARFEQMLAELHNGDVIFVYNPAIFGIGVEQAVENIRAVLNKGVAIRSVLYGLITAEWADQIEVAGEIVRECCSIERTQEIEHNRGLKEDVGGYFENGVWYEGQRRSYTPPVWAYHRSQRRVDVAQEKRSSPAVMWLDAKIMEGRWTTEQIWREYQSIARVLSEDVWEKIGKQWINTRRLELTR